LVEPYQTSFIIEALSPKNKKNALHPGFVRAFSFAVSDFFYSLPPHRMANGNLFISYRKVKEKSIREFY